VITVVVVDDQDLVRQGLRLILSSRFGFDLVGEYPDAERALARVARDRPDVVVMDLRMPGIGGIEATARIVAAGGPAVLVLTTFDDDESLSGALRAGASGFALKDAPGEELQQAVRAVATGEGWLDPAITGRVLAAYRLQPPAPVRTIPSGVLTPRETEVLRHIAQGASNGEIADALFIGEGTVKTHINRILAKLGARDRASAIVYAYDHGIVQPRA
jgi:DNA-binding NarL/FixJ family response regulator